MSAAGAGPFPDQPTYDFCFLWLCVCAGHAGRAGHAGHAGRQPRPGGRPGGLPRHGGGGGEGRPRCRDGPHRDWGHRHGEISFTHTSTPLVLPLSAPPSWAVFRSFWKQCKKRATGVETVESYLTVLATRAFCQVSKSLLENDAQP